jgi:DNA mismatch repair protein MSH2
VHGDDAVFVATTLFKTTTVIKYFQGTPPRARVTAGEERLPYVTLSRMAVEALVRDLLLQQQYRVEIWACPPGVKRDNAWKCISKVLFAG